MDGTLVMADVASSIEACYRADADRLWRALYAYAADAELASEAVAEAYAQALRRGDGHPRPRGLDLAGRLPHRRRGPEGPTDQRRCARCPRRASVDGSRPAPTATPTPTCRRPCASCPRPSGRRSSSSTTPTCPCARSPTAWAPTSSPCGPTSRAAVGASSSSWVTTMADLRARFAALDALPVPDLWAEVERRAAAEATGDDRASDRCPADLARCTAHRRAIALPSGAWSSSSCSSGCWSSPSWAPSSSAACCATPPRGRSCPWSLSRSRTSRPWYRSPTPGRPSRSIAAPTTGSTPGRSPRGTCR